jgi:hypothetical protein
MRVYVFPANTTAVDLVAGVCINRQPAFYGYDDNGADLALGTNGVGPFRFNYSRTTPYTWVANCFVGRRGSMHYHANADSTAAINSLEWVRLPVPINLAVFPSIQEYAGVYSLRSNDTDRDRRAYFWHNKYTVPTGAAGMSLYNQRTQTGASISAPFYSKYRFQSTNPEFSMLGTPVDGSNTDNIRLMCGLHPIRGASNDPITLSLKVYYEIGADFTFLGFLNVPSMRYLETTPLAP